MKSSRIMKLRLNVFCFHESVTCYPKKLCIVIISGIASRLCERPRRSTTNKNSNRVLKGGHDMTGSASQIEITTKRVSNYWNRTVK